MMRFKPFALAIAAAAPLASPTVWALDPTTTAAIAVGNQLYISGSTAIDPALQAFFELDASDARGPCAVGTMDLYKSAAGYVISCTGRAATTLAGLNIAILKQTAGGSAVGIINVARGTAASGFTAFASIGGCTLGTPTAASAPFMAYNNYSCAAAEVSAIPNAGVSDEDPTTFVGTGGVLNSDATTLTAANGLQQPFAIIVSKPLRDKLQSAEGLTSGSELLADQPSLTKQQIAAILSGAMLDWSDLWVYDKATHTTQTQVGTGGAVPTSGMHICRRGDTSGTQLGNNIFFFGAGCTKSAGVNSVATPDCAASQNSGEAWNASGLSTVCPSGTGSSQPSDFAFAGSGTGDVKKCVSSGTLGTGDTVNYRIGFVGTDNKSTDVAATPDLWRFIAIDEQPPTLYSILQGRYGNVTEDTLNSSSASLAQNGGLGNHGVIFSYITANVGNKTALAGLNAKWHDSMQLPPAAATTGVADTGLLTLGKPTGNADALTIPLSGSFPAALRTVSGAANTGPASTMSKTSGAVNNCNALFQVNPTG